VVAVDNVYCGRLASFGSVTVAFAIVIAAPALFRHFVGMPGRLFMVKLTSTENAIRRGAASGSGSALTSGNKVDANRTCEGL
jgi:hypothetical protein